MKEEKAVKRVLKHIEKLDDDEEKWGWILGMKEEIVVKSV